MHFDSQNQIEFLNHHGDSINPDFAKWISGFVSSFSEFFLITIFVIGLIIFIVSYIFILYFYRKR